MRQYQCAVKLELSRLANDFSEDFETNSLGTHYEASTFAGWTVFTQDMLQTFARSFARHFDEPERRNWRDLMARMILGHRLLQLLQNILPVIRGFHVDKIDNNNTAQVPQSQLPGDSDRRLQIGPVYRFLEIAVADVSACIDIDRRHRLCLIENNITT